MTFRSVLVASAADPAALRRALASAPDILTIADAEKLGDDALASLAGAAQRLWVRLAPLDDPNVEDQLAAVAGLRAEAVVLPAERPQDVEHLGARLAVHEADAGLADGFVRIVVTVENAGSLFEIHRLARASRRVSAIGWNGEALAQDLGADDDRELDGRWSDPLQTARALVLAAAADAGLPAIDSLFTDADPEALRRETERAARDGFAAKFAVTPEQAAIIGSAFGAKG
ncbi:CoA ester lyase [Chelatococcus sambhunathii]|uniref:CoA ester lyase n=1 Tax=Chelatococcus sambhunathii TaxID=363953 RepID=A0ABU1DBT4_9HYPH|nr:aldolase/citrate lyase family protein [Chelatococcus sambhunathii]MDR4305537.1 CoA ester lyase [Chelatococcus sambhunathii]